MDGVLGIFVPLVKYLAEAIAMNRPSEVNVLINTAMVAYGVVGLGFVMCMVLASNWIFLSRSVLMSSRSSGA